MEFPPPTEKQARVIWWALTALAAFVLLALAVGLVWGLGQVLALLSPVLWPLAIAGVIAYLLDPVVDFLVARRVHRRRAIVTVFCLAFVVVTGLFASVVPQIYLQSKDLVERIPGYTRRIQTRVDAWMSNPPQLVQRFMSFSNAPSIRATGGTNVVEAPAPETTGEAERPVAGPSGPGATGADEFWKHAFDRGTLKSASTWLAGVAPKMGTWLLGKVSKVASWLGIVAGLALVPIYTFYFLLEKRGIENRWTDYLPVRTSEFKDELVFVLRSINDYLIVFFRSQVLVAVCDGVLYTIGFIAIGLPYALLLGVMATVLTMIPFLGAIATCLAALVIAFVQYGDWTHPLLVLAVFGVVQGLEGLVISPKIMGDRVGLHPLTIIVSVMVGTTLLGGILGGILAIPLTAAMRVVMFRYVWKKRDAGSEGDSRGKM